MSDAFKSFTPKQLQYVADTGKPPTEGFIHTQIPLCLVDDQGSGFGGVTFEVQHPLANHLEGDAAAILAYGEEPLPEGTKQTATASLTANRRSTRTFPIIEGFNTDIHRLERLQDGGPIKMAEALQIVEQAAIGRLFDQTIYTDVVDLSGAAADLEALDPDINIWANVFSALRSRKHYLYRSNVIGASLEGFIHEDDLPIFGEYLELTGILGREGTAPVRLNPGGMSDDQIANAIRTRLRLDRLHVVKYAKSVALVNESAQGLSNPTDPGAGGTSCIAVGLFDRRSATYNLRNAGGRSIVPRFGPVLTTAGNGLNPELRSDFNKKRRIEEVWAEVSMGVGDITLLTQASNPAFDDMPSMVIFDGVNTL